MPFLRSARGLKVLAHLGLRLPLFLGFLGYAEVLIVRQVLPKDGFYMLERTAYAVPQIRPGA
jgi:hypothetical protein